MKVLYALLLCFFYTSFYCSEDPAAATDKCLRRAEKIMARISKEPNYDIDARGARKSLKKRKLFTLKILLLQIQQRKARHQLLLANNARDKATTQQLAHMKKDLLLQACHDFEAVNQRGAILFEATKQSSKQNLARLQKLMPVIQQVQSTLLEPWPQILNPQHSLTPKEEAAIHKLYDHIIAQGVESALHDSIKLIKQEERRLAICLELVEQELRTRTE